MATQPTAINSNWQVFPCNDAHKMDLFVYLTIHTVIWNQKMEYWQFRDEVNGISEADKAHLDSCNLEETYARTLLPVAHTAGQGLSRVLIQAVDTTVMVLLVSRPTYCW